MSWTYRPSWREWDWHSHWLREGLTARFAIDCCKEIWGQSAYVMESSFLHAIDLIASKSLVTLADFAPFLPYGAFGVLIVYVLLYPERAKTIAGWLWMGLSQIWKGLDRRAVANRVEGAINTAREKLLRNAPDDIIQGKLKIKWTTAEEAEAIAREGNVVVFMRESSRHEENLANAVMAYLPKAVLPRARRYYDHERIMSVDLTLAKSILMQREKTPGALDLFYERHLDPVRRKQPGVLEKLEEIDEIDLQGWLTRVLLVEYKKLGDQLFPGEPKLEISQDAESFAQWLHGLATREPGADTESLVFRGKFLKVGIIWVAIRERIEQEGLDPYRRRASSYIGKERLDAFYLMARDNNIPPVLQLAKEFQENPQIALVNVFRYRLRHDFPARVLPRERAIIVRLVPFRES